jgi:single-stranded-DNA-specific exonuclease
VLRAAGPWGQGFPEPVFDGDFQILDTRIVGGKHLKMQLKIAAGADYPIEAIAFGYVGGVAEDPRLCSGASVQLAYRLEVNEYRGVERVQLNCQHFRPA